MGIRSYCVEIYKLLIEVSDDVWSKEFASILAEFESTEIKSVLNRIERIYGGLGSFNDLVLYKNGKICFEENEKLDELRKGLFEELKNNDNGSIKMSGAE